MTIDEQLLHKAIAAGGQLADSERRALLARGEYHTAIRRLHLAGASLREIAQALGLSHQRVQQIVEQAGGTWWQRVWRTRGASAQRGAACTYCGHPPSEVGKLIAGPDLFICDACVAAAERTLGAARGRCVFCGKRAPIASHAPACADCLRQCRAILDR
jgi:ClpX C4-type zinc finger protein